MANSTRKPAPFATNLGSALQLSYEDLLEQLVTNTSNLRFIHQAARHRMVTNQEGHFSELVKKYFFKIFQKENGIANEIEHEIELVEEGLPSSRPIIHELTQEEFPWDGIDGAQVQRWMQYIHQWEFASETRKNRFHGEGMEDSEKCMFWIDTAIRERSEWRDLTPKAAKFWMVIRKCYMMFMFRKRHAAEQKIQKLKEAFGGVDEQEE